ncbi:MAG: 4-aminobutyrate--2-oxoglutarate transaminase [Candidatus Eremiobacteraeota bacterium]|nr:4-aminobutyrate--2-oxoglutarate transaminase [Candidatus Eremiobacteraeota bacterium]
MAIAASRTKELLELRASEVVRGVGNAHPIFTERAAGAKLWDVDGKEYIDFVGGIGVLNVGHAHPKVVAAVSEQLNRFTHTCFQVAMYESYVKLAEKLNRLAPGPSKKKTLLVTTGAEATENAVKIARMHTDRAGVIAFQHGFHGRTMLALTMTGKSAPYKQNFGPFCSDVYHAPYPYEHHGWTTARALQGLAEVFESEVAPNRVAAIIIEPVLGEGGFVPAPLEFLKELRRITSEHGIVLIADEIQSGIARTGTMFAIEHARIEPDIITIAKSIADGMPLAGVIGKAEIMDGPTTGGLGGTFGGNPLSCAAALAVLDIIEEERLLDRAVAIGTTLQRALLELRAGHAQIVDVRGRGAMIGFELGDAPQLTGAAAAAKIIDEARARGLLLLSAGAKRNVIRILVPLVISDADLDIALERLAQSCDAALART